MTALGVEDPHDTPAMAAVRASYRATEGTDTAFRHVGAPGKAANALTKQLDMVAKCAQAGVPTRVYTVQFGGFDTHADERDTQQRLLQTFDEALTPFLRQMATDRHGRTLSCWHIRSSGDGWRPTPRTAPTMARPARCSARAGARWGFCS
jgi:uncharacterized protein (DUF1501 family)